MSARTQEEAELAGKRLRTFARTLSVLEPVAHWNVDINGDVRIAAWLRAQGYSRNLRSYIWWPPSDLEELARVQL